MITQLYFLPAVVLVGWILHLLTQKFAQNLVSRYLFEANNLLRARNYTDGCSTPFKTYIHRWLSKSYNLCAAHDYGAMGLITVARPGLHNNLVAWLAHMSQRNPVYWLWGTVLSLVTLPWAVFRRDLNQKWLPLIPFYVALLMIIIVVILINKFPTGF